MNEKKAKKLRRSIMTHDEWLKEKASRTYIFTEFDAPPKIGNKVIFTTVDNTILFGIVSKKLPDHTYEVKAGTGVFTVGLGAMRPSRAACVPDKIGQYKEAKRVART